MENHVGEQVDRLPDKEPAADVVDGGLQPRLLHRCWVRALGANDDQPERSLRTTTDESVSAVQARRWDPRLPSTRTQTGSLPIGAWTDPMDVTAASPPLPPPPAAYAQRALRPGYCSADPPAALRVGHHRARVEREMARSHRSGVVGHDQLSRRRRVCGRGVVVERHRGPGGWQLSGWRCRGFWFCGACLGMPDARPTAAAHASGRRSGAVPRSGGARMVAPAPCNWRTAPSVMIMRLARLSDPA